MSMNVTAETTDKQILAPVQTEKYKLHMTILRRPGESTVAGSLGPARPCPEADLESFTPMGDDLVSRAQNVASAEAVAQVQLQYRNVCIKNPARRDDFLFDLIARGADDSWSGRKNDSQRSIFDAVRAWASSQMSHLRLEN